MRRAVKRADAAIRSIDELLSSRKLQRATRLGLLKLRRELQELRVECDVGKVDLVTIAFRWAIVFSKLQDIFDRFF